jgi:hypothetical protein
LATLIDDSGKEMNVDGEEEDQQRLLLILISERLLAVCAGDDIVKAMNMLIDN